ncbi:MAG TPA: glycosyltransferase family 39 protein [Pseudolabrys sp.]|nr:glycosyltransferase family 39 protein [Pseudolabrys sp.]
MRTVSPTGARPLGLAAWWAIAAGLIVAIGVGLRLIGTRGDLWLDEIWTLVLLEPVTSIGQIIWGINHDNNHFLNSFYLYLVGPGAPIKVQRALSVVLGSTAVAAAGVAVIRCGKEAALAAVLLFAVAYPMVHYSSEARGYAGLVLFSLLALIFLQRELDRPERRNRRALGAAIGLGLLSHLTMVATATTLAAWALWVAWHRTGSFRKAETATRTIFRPALVWTVVIAAAVLFGAARHGFTFGGADPFQVGQAVDGYGGMLRLLLGLPEQVPAWACLVGVAGAVTIAAYFWRRREDFHGSLYVCSVIALPVAMFLAHLPNLQFGRYFLFSGAMFLLFVAELLGRAWRKGGILKAVAALTLVALVAGNANSLGQFFANGRGHYRDAVADMAASGPFTYGTDSEFRVPVLVGFYSKRLAVSARNVRSADWCRERPDWMVIENPNIQRRGSDLTVGAPDCALTYRLFKMFPAWGLSGAPWAVYRR